MTRLLLAPRMEVPPGLLQPAAAVHQDGVFTRSQARVEGWSDDRQRALIREGIWVAVTPRVLRNREVEPGPWQCARAVALAGRLVVSHASAGSLWGLRSSGSAAWHRHVRCCCAGGPRSPFTAHEGNDGGS